MRKLLNTLFVLSEDMYLTLEGENVVLLRGGETAGRFPLHTLESILCFSYKGASPALMGKCVRDRKNLAFFTPRGRFLARTSGPCGGNILLRRAQYRMADDGGTSCALARNFILGKLYNCRWILERATRDHPMRVDVAALKEVSDQIRRLMPAVAACESLETLRGLEGKGAAYYFDAVGQLILQNEDVFTFNGRSRRPPLDPMNALLSFLYALLANDCAASLEGVGLDSQAGVLHRDRAGRDSLALDLMEELRPVLADRLALTLVNSRKIGPGDFQYQPSGAVLLNDDGRKTVLAAWQALLLARYMRGDLDAYPPFFWK